LSLPRPLSICERTCDSAPQDETSASPLHVLLALCLSGATSGPRAGNRSFVGTTSGPSSGSFTDEMWRGRLGASARTISMQLPTRPRRPQLPAPNPIRMASPIPLRMSHQAHRRRRNAPILVIAMIADRPKKPTDTGTPALRSCSCSSGLIRHMASRNEPGKSNEIPVTAVIPVAIAKKTPATTSVAGRRTVPSLGRLVSSFAWLPFLLPEPSTTYSRVRLAFYRASSLG
jgi:hypothetical protein